MSGASSDRRYGSALWKRRRKLVMQRDRWRCQVTADCPRPADCVDHIERVTSWTTDAEFFDLGNLRAACTPCNLARGIAAGFHASRGPRRLTARSRAYGSRDVIARDYTRPRP